MADEFLDPSRVTYFAATHTRGKARAFGIRAIDRLKHMYVIGKTGVGKSTMLENMAIQDIQNGEGLIFIDPHGSTAEKLLDFIPEERVKDVIYFDPSDTDFPLAFNIMEDVGFDQRHNVVSGLMGVFERLWADAWSARMQYILQNTLLALLEYPDSTLIDVNRMLINKEFRNDVVAHVTDQIVKSFWTEEFANYGDRYTQEATPAIQNKVGQLVSNPLVRNIIGQPRSSFDLRRAMDERKIIICNLAKGKMGDANSTMIGAVLVIRTYLASMSRAKESLSRQRQLPPCYFYVDEFQNVVNKAFANILSESRKYGLGLIIANQFIAQLNEKDSTAVKDAVFGNVGTTVVFKVGPLDAQELEPLFEPTFTVEDMVGLGVGQIYLTLSIDGITSPPFSAQTLPPIEQPPVSFRRQVTQYTREHYGTPRAKVEEFIQQRFAAFPITPPTKRTSGNGSRGNGSSSSGHGGAQGGSQNGSLSGMNGASGSRSEHAPSGARNQGAPRMPRPATAPAEILRAQAAAEKPAAMRPEPQPTSAEDAAPAMNAHTRPDEKRERNALKDAIAAAMQRNAAAHVEPAAPAQPRVHEREPGEPQPVTPSQLRASRAADAPAPAAPAAPEAPARQGSSEIPPEVLRRVLSDQ
ncbi:MAG TPA: type IV secretion system DNA-binding domain-containing protein [Candidatus Paceibacterota bacterium]|nr:type IV secretion system DNA-binding domain-containing protein [Candidatus Paceibacterota bacterium]